MTKKAKTWARRVVRWRASGQTSEQFCAGQGFSAGLLRHWACRLGNRVREREGKGTFYFFADAAVASILPTKSESGKVECPLSPLSPFPQGSFPAGPTQRE